METNDYLNDLGLTEDDLKEAKPLIFIAKEPVKLKILSFKEVSKPETKDKKAFRALFLTTKVMSGEYKGELFDNCINKNFKETYVKFLKCFYTQKELETAIKSRKGLPNLSRIVGTTVSTIPAAAKTVGDKTYQSFYDYSLVEEVSEEVGGDEDFS